MFVKSCPFCSRPWRFGAGRVSSPMWPAVVFIVLIFVSRGVWCEKRVSLKSKEADSKNYMTEYSQQILNESSIKVKCESGGGATPVGRCHPCSRFELAHQTTECIVTGYKQRVRCEGEKKEKYASCHYDPDEVNERTFWIFEFFVIVTLLVSYWTVHFRHRRNELQVARRIRQQISA